MEKVDLSLGPLELENMTQRTVTVLGQKGSGKTTLLKMIMYQLSVDYPYLGLYLFDPLSVIRIVGFDRVNVSKRDADKGRATARLLDRGRDDHLIISLNGMLQTEQAEYMNDLFGAWHPHDAIIGIDELHDFCPEAGKSGAYCSEVERAVRHWRNQNVGFIATSQRPAKINKDILELSDALIVHRMSGNRDRSAIEGYLGGNMESEEISGLMAELPTLQAGEAYKLDFRA